MTLMVVVVGLLDTHAAPTTEMSQDVQVNLRAFGNKRHALASAINSPANHTLDAVGPIIRKIARR